MKKVDIIIPAYNCENYIKQTIQSVKEQTYTEWQLIIIDDGSTDNTKEIIESEIKDIEEKVLFIVEEKNLGVAQARNIGINKSKNKYIAFLDADDIWKKEKLEKQVNFMCQNNYSFTYTNYEYLVKDKAKKVKTFSKKLNYKQALKNTYILTSTVMIDTEKIDRNNILMDNIGSEDTATWWKILKTGVIAYGLNMNLTTYRITRKGLSKSRVKSTKRTWKLYREQENLSLPYTIYNFLFYLFNAIKKRII